MITIKLIILEEITMNRCSTHWINRKELRREDRKTRLLLSMTMIG